MPISGKTKLIAARAKSDINRYRNSVKNSSKRNQIKANLTSATRGNKLNLVAVGRDGTALSTLNLKAVGDRRKRKLLGRLVKAAARGGR